MSNENIVKALINEDVYQAKKLINKALTEKMSAALEEKLINFAPSIFNEGKKEKPDFLDLDKDGNKKEPMKKAAKESKMKKEDVDFTANFEAELKALVEEIEASIGAELTEEEVIDVANELLDTMMDETDPSEQSDDEDYDLDQEEDR
jgi:hypothetical protein